MKMLLKVYAIWGLFVQAAKSKQTQELYVILSSKENTKTFHLSWMTLPYVFICNYTVLRVNVYTPM